MIIARDDSDSRTELCLQTSADSSIKYPGNMSTLGSTGELVWPILTRLWLPACLQLWSWCLHTVMAFVAMMSKCYSLELVSLQVSVQKLAPPHPHPPTSNPLLIVCPYSWLVPTGSLSWHIGFICLATRLMSVLANLVSVNLHAVEACLLQLVAILKPVTWLVEDKIGKRPGG